MMCPFCAGSGRKINWDTQTTSVCSRCNGEHVMYLVSGKDYRLLKYQKRIIKGG